MATDNRLQGKDQFSGTCIPMAGNDIDTDRIVPARYLKNLTFDGLGKHVFEDARRQSANHPFDAECFAGASILVVENNFGCGSSREHAPRALHDWGIRAIVGVSFAEIFFGNSTATGVPCVTVSPSDAAWLLDNIKQNPHAALSLDLKQLELRFMDRKFTVNMRSGPRAQILEGTWNDTAVLLQAGAQIETTAQRLPYIAGFNADQP